MQIMLQICNINQDGVRRMVRVRSGRSTVSGQDTSLWYCCWGWSQSSGGGNGGRCKFGRATVRINNTALACSTFNESCELSIVLHYTIPEYWTTHVQRPFTLSTSLARALFNWQCPTQTHVRLAIPFLWPSPPSLLLPCSWGRMHTTT